MAGRKVRWPEKVSASELVLNLYSAIASVQSRLDLFMDCHVFEGAILKHVPYVTINEETIPLPKVLATFVGIPFGKKTCNTHGCCNPLHFQGISTSLKGLKAADIPLTPPNPIEEYVEAIEYQIDKHELKEISFEILRPLIPIEDMSDELLTLSIEKLKS